MTFFQSPGSWPSQWKTKAYKFILFLFAGVMLSSRLLQLARTTSTTTVTVTEQMLNKVKYFAKCKNYNKIHLKTCLYWGPTVGAQMSQSEGVAIQAQGLVCWSLTSLCHSNGHIETMPAREINPFIALTRIRFQFLRTQWSTSNHQRVDTTTPLTAQPSGLCIQAQGISFHLSSVVQCLNVISVPSHSWYNHLV